MKLTINLLPPEKRKTLYNIYILYFIKIITETLLAYAAFLAIFLILAGAFLKNNISSFSSRSVAIEREYSGLNQQIKQINKILLNASIAQSAYFDWTEFLIKLSKIKMDGIYLTGVDIKKETQSITLQGRSKTRRDLLEYKKNLEETELIKDLGIPNTILTTKENIDFNLSGLLNLK